MPALPLTIDKDMGKIPSNVSTVVRLFHRVRCFTYLSDGVRDPRVVAARGAGSCTGKHILLRDWLRKEDIKADVEFVRGDFAASVPCHHSMPSMLKQMVNDRGIVDYHNFVIAEVRGRSVTLDATWHDALAPFGFSINADWNGVGNTRLAVAPEKFLGVKEDVIAFKRICIDKLPDDDKSRRLKFIRLLSNWIANIATQKET